MFQPRSEDVGSLGSVDDEMIDLTVSHSVMTKPPSRSASNEDQQPPRAGDGGASEGGASQGGEGDMPLNIIS